MLLERFIDVCNQMVLIFGHSTKRNSICHENIQMKGFVLNALKESNPFPIQQQIVIAFRDYIKKPYFNVQYEISKNLCRNLYWKFGMHVYSLVTKEMTFFTFKTVLICR